MNFHNDLDRLIKTCESFNGLSIIEIQEKIFGSQQNYGKRIKKPENIRISEILSISKQTGLNVKDIVVSAFDSISDVEGLKFGDAKEPVLEQLPNSELLNSKDEQIKTLRELVDNQRELINVLKGR